MYDPLRGGAALLAVIRRAHQAHALDRKPILGGERAPPHGSLGPSGRMDNDNDLERYASEKICS